MIAIVNYGVGNLGALVNMFDFIECVASVTDDPRQIEQASHLVLPGVGAFDAAVFRLVRSGLVPALEQAVLARQVPLLGICLGMQLLGRGSEEGMSKGLGWIEADTIRLRPSPEREYKVPSMGWANVVAHPHAVLLNGNNNRYYFSHGYHMECDHSADVVATYQHGQSVVCAIQQGNIYGVQFHPEKSHRFGMALLKDFVRKT